MNQIIKCPNCQKEFNMAEGLISHLKTIEDQAIEKIKKDESKKANEEAEKKYKTELENKDKQLAQVQKNIELKLKDEADKKLELAKKEAIKKSRRNC